MTGPAASPEPPTPPSSRKGWELLVAGAAVALFLPSLWFGWVYDDQFEVVLNPLVQSLRRLPELLSSPAWAASGPATYLYRPLTGLTFALNYAISGLAPWSYHLVNLLLHAAVSVMVFRLGRAWGMPTLAAGLGALVFAVHPVHVEVVAPAYGRKDLLAAGALLLMVHLHRRALAGPARAAFFSALAYAAALLSKEVGAVGIGLVAAHDIVLSRSGSAPPRPAGRRAWLYAAYGGVLLLYLLVRQSVVGTIGVPETSPLDNPLVAVGPWVRIATALAVLAKGVLLQLLPLRLSPDYSFDSIPLVQSIGDLRLAVAAGLVALSVLVIRTGIARKQGFGAWWLLLALLWYAITVLPTSNLLMTVGTIFGERLLYLPSVASCLAMGAAVQLLYARHRRSALLLATVLVAGFSAQTLRYGQAWKNDIALFQWAVESVPRSTKAHHKLGEELLRADRLGEALRHLNEAVAIAPDNEYARVTLLQAQERIVSRYLDTGEGPVAPPPPRDAEIQYFLGQVSRQRGDLAGAERYWKAALAADPDHPGSLADLGVLRLQRGDTAGAVLFLERAARNDPRMASAWFALAQVHLARGETAEALTALRRFLDTAGQRFPQQVRWARATIAALSGS